MARKRGGLAGLYDRNKGLIRTGATIGASLLGGPLAGAATGAAFRGLDREGKRGIGFDVGQGALGALEGYSMGRGAESAKGLLTGARAAGAAVGPLAQQPAVGVTGGFFPSVGGAGTNPLAAAGTSSANAGTSLGQRARDLFGAVTGDGKKGTSNVEVFTDIAKGLYGTRKDLLDRELQREKLSEERRQFDINTGFDERRMAIAAAQEADRKRREDELMAARAKVRAMFGGA